MKEENNNAYKFVLILFGASIGSIFALVISLYILQVYRKQQLKECNWDKLSDIEHSHPFPRQSYYSYNNINGDSKLHEMEGGVAITNNGDKRESYKEMRSTDKNTKLKSNKDKEYLCANNNTCCSSNLKRNNTFDISSISSNDSIHNNRIKPTSNSCQYLSKKRFSPICASSPLPKEDNVYSTNDTFSINEFADDTDASVNSGSRDHFLSQKTNNLPNSSNGTISTVGQQCYRYSIIRNGNSVSTNFSHTSEDLDSNTLTMNKTDEWNLFDPRYVSEDCPLRDNEQRTLTHDGLKMTHMCCQQDISTLTATYSHFDRLCQAFGDVGTIQYDFVEPGVTNEIIFHQFKVIAMFIKTPILMAIDVYIYMFWYTICDVSSVAVACQCSRDNNDIVGNITEYVSFKEVCPQTLKTNVTDYTKLINSQGSTANRVSFNYSFRLPQSNIIESDNAWKGRSRKTIKK